MKKKLAIALVLFTFIISCNKKEEAPATAPASEKSPEALPPTEVQLLKNDSLSYHNGVCIKDITVKDSLATLTFTTDFNTFKKLHPKCKVTPQMLQSWWNNEMAFYATFVNNTAIVLRDHAFVNRVTINVLYPDGIIHSTDVSRKDWETFYGMTTAQIRDNWKDFDKRFFNEKGRTAFSTCLKNRFTI